MGIETARAAYGRLLDDTITVKRTSRTGEESVAEDVRGQTRSYSADQIAGTIQQGDQEIIVFKPDLDAGEFPNPPAPGDKVTTSDGRVLTVRACDPNSRKIGTETIAYVLQCRG